MQRLFAKFTRSPAREETRETDDDTDADSRPPGSRSGRGAASVEPYLRQARSTRPGPLE